MDHKTFKEFANAMTEYIANYLENIRDRRVVPTVEPGYLRPLIPADAPENAEKWQDVMSDIEKVIMPGVTHWHSPRFHAYFPTANSYPGIVADMLSDAIACIGFSWIASPACTELEVVMLDWLGKLLDLPKEFLACSGGKGGGVIQGTASEATLVALLGAKARALRKAKAEHPDWTDYDIISKFRAYASKQAHSSVERAGLLGGVQFVLLDTDDKHRLQGETLDAAIEQDIKAGNIPFFVLAYFHTLLDNQPPPSSINEHGYTLSYSGQSEVVATLGTTSCCAFDLLDDIGDVSRKYDVWLHVDAAYAGSAFICPEFRHLMKGIEKADSFNFNPHKWMLVTFDCSAMWLKDPSDVVDAFNVDPLYLKHDQQGSAPDYRHWQIPLGRRFRSLKLWFVLRLYGAENLRAHIRKQVGLAHLFESLLLEDSRFEIFSEVIMGLVCFRLKGSNELNEKLLKMINAHGKIHLVPSKIKDSFFLRLAICSRYTEEEDIRGSWAEIQAQASNLVK